MKKIFPILLLLITCSKDFTDYSAYELLNQGGWKVIGIYTPDNKTILYNTGYPELFIRFNKTGIINGNYDGKYMMLNDSTISFYMQLDTNYAPYPNNFYILAQTTAKEQKAVLQFRSFKELKILGEKYIFDLELY